MKKKSVFKNKPMTRGLSFGITSAVITTLGMIVGLESAIESKFVIIAGILSISIADAMSDAFGIHISEEASGTKKELWTASIYAFLSKFWFALLFIVPFTLLNIQNAVIASIILGLSIITIYTFMIAKKQNKSRFKAILEHLAIALIVIIITHFVGDLIRIFIQV